MSDRTTSLLAQTLALATGLLVLSATLTLWRRSLAGATVLLAVQGVALAVLVATVGGLEGDGHLYLVAVLVLAVKAGIIPWIISRAAAATGSTREVAPLVNPTAGLLLSAASTTLAYLVARPVLGANPGAALAAVPVGFALILIGFLMLLTRRQAVSQMIGFVVVDNGIAAVAVLLAGGVPLVVELGVMLDVVLVVAIQTVLARRVLLAFGGTDLAELNGLRD